MTITISRSHPATSDIPERTFSSLSGRLELAYWRCQLTLVTMTCLLDFSFVSCTLPNQLVNVGGSPVMAGMAVERSEGRGCSFVALKMKTTGPGFSDTCGSHRYILFHSWGCTYCFSGLDGRVTKMRRLDERSWV